MILEKSNIYALSSFPSELCELCFIKMNAISQVACFKSCISLNKRIWAKICFSNLGRNCCRNALNIFFCVEQCWRQKANFFWVHILKTFFCIMTLFSFCIHLLYFISLMWKEKSLLKNINIGYSLVLYLKNKVFALYIKH